MSQAKAEGVLYKPSDPSYPEITIPHGFMFTAEELKALQPQLEARGLKVDKVGPIRLPLHLEGDQKIHFVVKGKGGERVPVLFFQSGDRDPIRLELYLGQLAIWDKFGKAPVVVYTTAPLPEHFGFYLSGSPLAKIELGLRAIYIYDLLPFIVKDVNLKKREFISETVQGLLKRNLDLKFKMTDYVQNMAAYNVALRALNDQVGGRNERMASNLGVVTNMLAFMFGSCLRFESGLEWTNRALYDTEDQMHIILKSGWLLSPKAAVDHAARNNIPLQSVYMDLKSAIQANMQPQFARRPTPKRKEYVRRYLKAGDEAAVQESIRALVAEYAPLGLFRGQEWSSQETIREHARRICGNWPGEAELPEYVFLHYLNQILNFDTEDSEDPDAMAGVAKDIFMLSRGDLIPTYFDLDYNDPQDQHEIIRFGLGRRIFTVVADRAEGEAAVIEFVDCLNAILESAGAPSRYHWVGFTDDQTACLAYLDLPTSQRLLWTKGWPLRMVQKPFDRLAFWLKYAQALQFLTMLTREEFGRMLKSAPGFDEAGFRADPGKALAEMMVAQDGFALAAGASPQEALAAASVRLERMGMFVKPGGDAMPGLPPNAAGKREVPVPADILDSAPGWEAPSWVMAELNKVLAAWDVEFIEKDMGSGSLGYAITARGRAEWAVGDGILGFRKPGLRPPEKPKPIQEDTWSGYIR